MRIVIHQIVWIFGFTDLEVGSGKITRATQLAIVARLASSTNPSAAARNALALIGWRLVKELGLAARTAED